MTERTTDKPVPRTKRRYAYTPRYARPLPGWVERANELWDEARREDAANGAL